VVPDSEVPGVKEDARSLVGQQFGKLPDDLAGPGDVLFRSGDGIASAIASVEGTP
jgi:hypothetical protein